MTLSIIILVGLLLLVMVLGAVAQDFSDEQDGPTPVPKITARAVEKLAFVGGTDQEIADRFQVDVKFLRQRYRGVLRVARALRKLAIRGYQSDQAKKSVPMQIWLGRNELGQSQNPTPPEEQLPEIHEPDDGA